MQCLAVTSQSHMQQSRNALAELCLERCGEEAGMHGRTAQGYVRHWAYAGRRASISDIRRPALIHSLCHYLHLSGSSVLRLTWLVRGIETKMGKKRRPARRIFGRPRDGPGPQETFEGEFQLTPGQAPSPSSQRPFRLGSSSYSGTPTSATASALPNSGLTGSHHCVGSSSLYDSGASSSQGPSVPLETAPNVIGKANNSAADGHAKRRRPSTAGSQVQGGTSVSTIQAAGATFSRSRWNDADAFDAPSAPRMDSASANSRPTMLAGGSPLTMSSPRGAHRLGPDGSSELHILDCATSSLQFELPSGSMVLHNYRRRQPSYGSEDMSPVDTSSSLHPSPSVVAYSPNSLNGVSIPSSVYAPSPLLGPFSGRQSPQVSAPDGALEEPPPLVLDQVAEELRPARLRPRSHSSSYVNLRRYNALAMSSEASQSSISVPELGGLLWPAGLFSSDAHEDESTSDGDKPTRLALPDI
ncbi:hypothetical protein BD414DRAFT_488990 [Trametes punicea]|nr:hypothetical protein BD414DRAFT_488990 [Trametes punicea]